MPEGPETAYERKGWTDQSLIGLRGDELVDFDEAAGAGRGSGETNRFNTFSVIRDTLFV